MEGFERDPWDGVTVTGNPPGVLPPEELIEKLRCPDCSSQLQLRWKCGPDAAGLTVWYPTILHDDTCRVMIAITRRRDRDRGHN